MCAFVGEFASCGVHARHGRPLLREQVRPWTTRPCKRGVSLSAVVPDAAPPRRSGQSGERDSGAGPAKLNISGLKADEFRHPLDLRATRVIRRLFGLESIVRSLLRPAIEQVLFMDNISSGVLVGPKQLPSLYAQLQEACRVLNIRNPPDLFLRQASQPNAYTLAMPGSKPFIVLHTSLVEILTKDELQAVIAHELGHLKCEHGVWLLMANITLLLADLVRLPYLSDTLQNEMMQWLRAAELSCDRAALLVAQDANVVVSTMMKLMGGTTKFGNEMNIEEYKKQVEQYRKANRGPLAAMLRQGNESMTHPLPLQRVVEIEKWAMSTQYKTLLRRSRRASA